MKFKNRVILFFFILSLFFLSQEISEARIVTDQLGRKMNVPDDPKRIIAFAPSITEIIFALGQEHRLKGVTLYSNYPEPAGKLPKVGSYVHLDLEKIVSLKPDLCIAVKDGNPISVIKRLDSLHIPVYAIETKNLNDVIETVLELGSLLNADQQAEILARDMQTRIKNITEKIETTDHKPTVFFQIGISPIVSIGSRSFIHELIVLAGGKNLAQGDSTYPRFSEEQIISLKPDIFIVSSMTDKNSNAIDQLKSRWRQYPQIPAVQNDRLYHVDSDIFDRPTPRLVDALELLAELIHPEVFTTRDRKVYQ